jgi:hypothetical protein
VFLQNSAVATGALAFSRVIARAAATTAANSRLRLALIGVGQRGKVGLTALDREEIVAFCDVDFARGRDAVAADKTVAPSLARFPQAKWFHDYRLLFEQMADQIDAVVVCVPDFMHFPIAMAAIRLGKHVFIEKPLCRCITEVRALRDAAASAGVITQMGNQGRTGEGIRLAREWVQAGLLGRVHTVHAWTNGGTPAYYSHDWPKDGGPEETPPATLRYDLWQGVSPERPYRRLRSHQSWRGCVDYGTGRLGDWACHQMDAAFYALDLDAPTSVEPASTEPKPATFPALSTLEYRFAARGARGPVTLKWFDGAISPPQPVEGFTFRPDGGSIFYGDKGMMWVASHSASARLLPETRMQELSGKLPPKTIPRVAGGPHVEWVEAIRARKRCGSDFAIAAPLVETALLGVAAMRARARLEWDPAAGRVTNLASANRFIGPGYDYRPGWGV